MKYCPRCKTEKPFAEFSRATANKDGYHGHCKQCVSTRNKQVYAERGKHSWRYDSRCVRCERILPKTMFAKHGRSCRDCLDHEERQHALGLKQCCDCQEWLTHDKFQPSKLKVYRAQCRGCVSAQHAGRKDKARNTKLKKEYGVTGAQYDELVARQGGKCPVCKEPLDPNSRSHSVDHAHGGAHAGRIRGVVHRDCNRFVLWTHDDSTMLRNAAELIDNPLTDWYVPGVPTNQRRAERNKK